MRPNQCQHFGHQLTLAVLLALSSASVSAADAMDAGISERLSRLENELAAVRHDARAEENASTQFHLAGYASAGFVSSDESDSFTVGSFNPGFHFQYDDKVLFEAELEIESGEDGETEVAMEYAALSYIVNDFLIIKMGKWLSPVGQFQERLHPSWINKLPSAPVGFGHGGAQPLSDVGVQLRASTHAGSGFIGFVVAAGNGPRGGHHGPELEGYGADDNDNKAISARLSYFLPGPHFELGVSALSAELTGEEPEGDCDAVGADQACDPTDGDVDLVGFDFSLTPAFWDIRGEFLSSELGSHFSRESHRDAHTTLVESTEWTVWYVQAAYQFAGIVNSGFASKLEGVVRYGDLDIEGAFAGDGETRIDIGLNYLIAPSVIAKLAWESSDFDEEDADDEDRIVAQFAFGF